MLVKYRIPVEHSGSAPGGAQFQWGGATYKFKISEGKLEELEVLVPGFPAVALPQIIPPSATSSIPTISIPADPIWPDIERSLMFVEGVVAMFGLKRFDFERRTTEWIPETDKERASAQLLSFKVEKDAKTQPTPVAFDMFARALVVADELSSLETGLNFNRRGRDDLAEGRYIEAVYDFYFVLETLFANGSFKKNEVLRNFVNRKELIAAVSTAKLSLTKDRAFLRDLSAQGCVDYLKRSEKDLLEHLIQVRGFLHHHSAKNPKAWHPNEQKGYRVDAIFLAQTCFSVLSDRVFSSMYSAGALERFSKIEFVSEEGKRIRFVDMEISEI